MNTGKVTVRCPCGQEVDHEQWCQAVPVLLPIECTPDNDTDRLAAWMYAFGAVSGFGVCAFLSGWPI